MMHGADVDSALRIQTGRGLFRDIFRNGPARFGNRAFIAIAIQMAADVRTECHHIIILSHIQADGEMALLMSAVLFSWKILISPLRSPNRR